MEGNDFEDDRLDADLDEPGVDDKCTVIYGVEDTPAPHMSVVFALQQAILCIGSTLSIPFILGDKLCTDLFPAQEKANVIAQLLSISMFMCGLATLLQTTFGVRLGIIQGGSHVFIAPIVAMMSLEKWKCPTSLEIPAANETNITTFMSQDQKDELWQSRLREIQGNLMLASVIQVVLGCTGIMGLMLKYIGPLTIAPTISLIGLSLTAVAADFNRRHWGIAMLTLVLIGFFTLILGRVRVPCLGFNLKRKCYVFRYPVFQLMPVLLSVGICWLLSYILTVTDTLPNNSTLPAYKARTDSRLAVVSDIDWFFFPYPFRFGIPTVSAAGFVGMLGATLSSVIESVGDYFAAARISNASPPPPHAINRGIAAEGFSSIISGMVGAGHATTSYSGNIGAIGITKVASRRVFQVAGLILLIGGIIGKFGAVLTLIPDPIIGGTLTIVFGMVAAVGISVLQFIDFSSTRNLTILAISMILGLMIPQWLSENTSAIDTGSEDLDQVLKVLLGTAMFVGGVLGFILDNLVPGTLEERGILKWRESLYTKSGGTMKPVMYEYPYVTKYIQKINCCSYFPLSPTFDKELNCSCCSKETEASEPSKSQEYHLAVGNGGTQDEKFDHVDTKF
ncbi:solute carrier family 23 member 2-like isoform X1 [Mytilus californianus]|uniref:solute carrier family 23 member 2-like isoform X1 n=1 Tax=Mytilus californianus TaxID=6549 RepID=UPI0022470956|nr:solute carrier family 23 member 2-like isoform X1 [Mytilus californianus]